MEIFIGNIHYQVTEPELRKLFELFGTVDKVTIVRDKNVVYKRYAFVVMPEIEEAKTAIDYMDGQKVKGRNLTVKESVKYRNADFTRDRMVNRNTKKEFEDHKKNKAIPGLNPHFGERMAKQEIQSTQTPYSTHTASGRNIKIKFRC